MRCDDDAHAAAGAPTVMRHAVCAVLVLGLCCVGGNPPPVPHKPHKPPPPPHRRPPPPPPPRPTLSFNFRVSATTEGFSTVNSRPAHVHHSSADYWVDSSALGIRKTHHDTKADKNFTTIKLIKTDAEYSMRPFFNETACYKFPLNKPSGKDVDIFHQIVANDMYGGIYKYWELTKYQGLLHGEGCPAKGCQRWAYYHETTKPPTATVPPHAADGAPDSVMRRLPAPPPPPPLPPPPHHGPPAPPPPLLQEWGEFWLNGDTTVQIHLRSVTTEHQDNRTYTSTSNSTTKFRCGLPGRVSCGQPRAVDFSPTTSCADMIGPGGPTGKKNGSAYGWDEHQPAAADGWIDGFSHHLPTGMGSDPVYSPAITPVHLLESVNSPWHIAEVNTEEGLGWRAAAIPRWDELSRLDMLPMLRARLSILPSLEVKRHHSQLHTRRRLEPAGARPEVRAGNDTIPREFDARKHWPSCISIGTLRNQGNCGACYAMAAVEVLEDRLCIQDKYNTLAQAAGAGAGLRRPAAARGALGEATAGAEEKAAAPMCPSMVGTDAAGSSPSAPVAKCLSAEYLISCDAHDSGCEGGYIDNAWRFLNLQGVPSEACDPYSHCQYPQLKNCTEPNATAAHAVTTTTTTAVEKSVSEAAGASDYIPPSFMASGSSVESTAQANVRCVARPVNIPQCSRALLCLVVG